MISKQSAILFIFIGSTALAVFFIDQYDKSRRNKKLAVLMKEICSRSSLEFRIPAPLDCHAENEKCRKLAESISDIFRSKPSVEFLKSRVEENGLRCKGFHTDREIVVIRRVKDEAGELRRLRFSIWRGSY